MDKKNPVANTLSGNPVLLGRPPNADARSLFLFYPIAKRSLVDRSLRASTIPLPFETLFEGSTLATMLSYGSFPLPKTSIILPRPRVVNCMLTALGRGFFQVTPISEHL